MGEKVYSATLNLRRLCQMEIGHAALILENKLHGELNLPRGIGCIRPQKVSRLLVIAGIERIGS